MLLPTVWYLLSVVAQDLMDVRTCFSRAHLGCRISLWRAGISQEPDLARCRDWAEA